MLNKIGLSIQTMFADLIQRSHDAAFDRDFPVNGSFYRKQVKGKSYWYYNGYAQDGKRYVKYVGPDSDPEIASRIQNFHSVKTDFNDRRKVVRALVAAGLPQPLAPVGKLIDALARAGIFRLRACLVGTSAFQTYSGVLGVMLPSQHLQTVDIDIAQFLSVAIEVEDSVPEIPDILNEVDHSFRPVSHMMDGRKIIAFQNNSGLRVEFLTPNRGSDDYQAEPPILPALGGVAAQPLRFLDFLIRDPIRSVLLYGGGVLVNVPAPERYALHKLIVATRRRSESAAKIEKDLAQAGVIIEAMAEHRQYDLYDAWNEAFERGEAWRIALQRGMDMLAQDKKEILKSLLERCESMKR
ncbi:MAG: hypothetical protein HQL43_16830 [Alphaproteobacteria bacterium]|nr:hypothetical protein [Alphaproteobacteria bacterium]